MFSVFETFDDSSKRSAFGTPDIWEVDGYLCWPPVLKKMNHLRKVRAVPEENWPRTANYKVLARNLRKSSPISILLVHFLIILSQASFKACLAKEKELEMYSDSESAKQAERVKALKRRHPVNAKFSDLNLYDLSSDFEITTSGNF